MRFRQLLFTALPGVPIVQPGDNLARLILEGLERAAIELVNGDVVVLAQKIVSKAEGRLVGLQSVQPSTQAIDLAEETGKDPRVVELILRESRKVLRTRDDLIIVEHRLGFVCANAGIDHSNVADLSDGGDESVLLLPEDPDVSAAKILEELCAATDIRPGVLIIDSHGRAWRMGTVGISIGAAGFPMLLDLRGRPDMTGRVLRVTQVGLGDEVAAGASVLMGQADERTPIVHLRGLPLLRPEEFDLFR
jgi:coenzyme F420-0:L-glutamate ligase/coenzyme F420-1:gamma-L-glutamate ligase